MYKYFPVSALAIACASGSLAAGNDQLEEIVVTSSRIAMPIREVATSMSVISGDEIRQRGFTSLFDVLRTQPGVSVSNSGGAGKATSLRIRGEEGFRTLVLLDGIDISDASGTQSGPKIEHLLSSGIERVEILRGPQGLMYGADAGGIISISTEAPYSGFGGSVSAEGGRYDTRQLGVDFGVGNDKVDFNVSAVDFKTNGFNARTTDTVLKDDDGYDNTTVHARLGWNIIESLRLQLVARNVSSENAFDGCFTADTFSPTNDCTDDFDQAAWRVDLDYAAGRFTHQLYYSGNDTRRQFYADGASSFKADGELERGGYLGSFTASDAMRFVYGVDIEAESMDDGSLESERHQNGYYLEYQGGFLDKLYITAGVRLDENEDFGTHTSYRLSGAYLFDVGNGELKLRATAGTGFRAPSLYEISYNNSFAFPPASETELAEEKSEGFDIGLSWMSDGGLFLEAVVFDQVVIDEIYFDLETFSGYLQSDGDTSSTGVELIGEKRFFNSLTIAGNYTYNDTENASGSARIRRPKHLLNVGLSWQGLSSKLILGLNVRGSYGAEDIDGSTIDDYEVVDINASYEVIRGLQLYGRVENLFDTDYEEVPTYNTSGAAAYAGLRYSF